MTQEGDEGVAAVLEAFAFLQGFHSSCSLHSNQIQGKQAWDDGQQLADKHCGANAGTDGGLDCGSSIL